MQDQALSLPMSYWCLPLGILSPYEFYPFLPYSVSIFCLSDLPTSRYQLQHLLSIYSFNKYLLNLTLCQGLGMEQWTRPKRPLLSGREKNQVLKDKNRDGLSHWEKISADKESRLRSEECRQLLRLDGQGWSLRGGDTGVETWMTGKYRFYQVF